MRKVCSTAERSKSMDKYEIELGRYKTRIFALLATEASGLPGIKSEECANCDHRCSLEIGCYCFNYGCGKGRTTEELHEAFDRVCDALKISDRKWTPANPMRPEVFDSPDLLEALEDRLLQLAEENKCTRWEENRQPRQECTLCGAHRSDHDASNSECTGSGRCG